MEGGEGGEGGGGVCKARATGEDKPPRNAAMFTSCWLSWVCCALSQQLSSIPTSPRADWNS